VLPPDGEPVGPGAGPVPDPGCEAGDAHREARFAVGAKAATRLGTKQQKTSLVESRHGWHGSR
jgi:hypothetical protein